MRWYGTFDGETLVGVMGLERRGMAALCRHAYVLSACRRRGIGARRREHLEAVAAGAERSMTGPQRAAMLTPTTRDGRWPERKVKQILLNLLANAVKFTPEGGRVGLTATAAADGITITVSDTGIGIAPEDQAAIFEESVRSAARTPARRRARGWA